MSPKIQFHFLPRNLRMRTGWLVAVLSLGPFTTPGVAEEASETGKMAALLKSLADAPEQWKNAYSNDVRA